MVCFSELYLKFSSRWSSDEVGSSTFWFPPLKQFEMVECVLNIEGSDGVVAAFFEANRTPERDLSFEQSVPAGGEPFEAWGTDREPLVGMGVDYDSGTYSFETAWSPPEKWLKTVAKKYPDLTFTLTACVIKWGDEGFKSCMVVRGDETLKDETTEWYAEVTKEDALEFIREQGWDPRDKHEAPVCHPDEVEAFLEDAEEEGIFCEYAENKRDEGPEDANGFDIEFHEDDLKEAVRTELSALLVGHLMETRFPTPLGVYASTILIAASEQRHAQLGREENGGNALCLLAPSTRLPRMHSLLIKRAIAEFAGVQFGSEFKRLIAFVESSDDDDN